jgi:peptidyl-prolyl cis-trans isomerase C
MVFATHATTAVCAAALVLGWSVLDARAQDASSEPAEAPAAASQPATPPSGEAAQSEPARNPTDVVAKVGETVITEQDVTIARQEFASELGNVPENEQRGLLIDALVNMEMLAQAARDAGLDKSPAFEQRLEFFKTQALRNLFVEQNIVNAIKPEDLQAGYDRLVRSEHKQQEEVHARHILVETKEEAEKVIADLKAGASFEELAKQSKDPSGQNGGDLGFFGRGQMVKTFEDAAFALQPGAITEQPVQSQFGWHVIRLEEKRMSEPPALADVEDQLRQFLLREKFQATLTELRATYDVEIVGQAGESPAAQPQEMAPAGAAPASGGSEAPASEPAEETAPN